MVIRVTRVIRVIRLNLQSNQLLVVRQFLLGELHPLPTVDDLDSRLRSLSSDSQLDGTKSLACASRTLHPDLHRPLSVQGAAITISKDLNRDLVHMEHAVEGEPKEY